jgi:hypothetical protein
MSEQDAAEQPLLEPAEGATPEQQDALNSPELAESPLDEPAEGAVEDAD